MNSSQALKLELRKLRVESNTRPCFTSESKFLIPNKVTNNIKYSHDVRLLLNILRHFH